MIDIFFPKDSSEAKHFSRLCQQGKMRRIYQGVYTDDLSAQIEDIVQQNWMQIAAHIVTDGILSFRTAMDLKPSTFKDNQLIIFMTSNYNKKISLPGLVISVQKGNNKKYIEQVIPALARSNEARLLLENLSQTRKPYKGIKTIGQDGVEEYLAKLLSLRGEDVLNNIRDQAKVIAEDLNYLPEYKKLGSIISALLSTNEDDSVLSTPYARATAKKQLYDRARLALFDRLAQYLKQLKFLMRDYSYSKTSYQNLAFFESYFSNFIEGTEFIIDEAEDIVFQGREVNHRHADSHDVLAHYQLSNDFLEMGRTPNNEKELLEILQTRHTILLHARPEKQPGAFKQQQNKAGNTYFVEPQEVVGTLCHAFELYHTLADGMAKALWMHFLISEVHPFADGNGRLARIMMNAELVASDQYKIIIPTVLRDNYLNGLRLVTRDQQFQTYCKMLDQAQAYTASIDWLDYGAAREKIENDFADKAPDEGLPIFNRVLRKLKLSDI